MEDEIIVLFSKNILNNFSAPKYDMAYIIMEIIKIKMKLIFIIFKLFSRSSDP